MKKFLLPAAFVSLILASCSNEEFAGFSEVAQKKGEIGFSMSVPNLTRATTEGASAAQKLNNNFVVYGFKYYSDSEPTASGDVADATKQQEVFERFNVNYIGNAGTTKTNAKGWEYVGYNDLQGDLQTLKYWDYTAKGYVFSAIAGVGVTPTKTESGTTVYDKGWTVTIPAGGSLSALYASARVPVSKSAEANVNKYPETVNLTFYAMGTKIRFGIYETVPGYEVHIDKFYCMDKDGKFTSTSSTTTNFGINGKFLTPNVDKATELTVTYYDNTTSVENRPKITFDTASVSPANSKSALFGTNMQATASIGETSVTATYDKTGGEYTYVLPFQDPNNSLQLYVDFTLKAANGETIKVQQARATVPAAYTQWKENFAYTYLFKISDNTNGTTGEPKDPNDPTKPWDPSETHDPEGLYAITFDACIVNTEDGLSQDGVQELITSLTTPSINTYAKGIVATANNEYAAGDIYYSAKDSAAAAQFVSTANSAVYEIVYSGTANITEALVADYSKDNGFILVPVATTAATSVPLSDGTNLTFSADQCKKFTAAAGKNYAIVYTVGGKETFKVVRVAGTPATTVTYSVAVPGSQEIKATDGYAVFKLINSNATYGVSGANILGAATFFKVFDSTSADVTENFTITPNTADGYRIALTPAAIAAGANGTYTVKYGTTAAANTFTIDIDYAIAYTTGTTATVVKDGSTDKVTLTVASGDYSGAKIANEPAGITVTDNGDGTYTIAADETASIGATTDLTIAGQSVSVEVISFSFDKSTYTINWPEGKTAQDIDEDLTIRLQKNGTNENVQVTVVSSNPAVFATHTTDADGILAITPLAGGNTILSYENAKFNYTVNQYELKSGVATIAKATESTKLTFWLNGEQLNATTATVKVYKETSTSDVYETTPITTGFSLTSDGRDLTFGNVTAAGKYKIEYSDGKTTPTVLGFEVITVN